MIELVGTIMDEGKTDGRKGFLRGGDLNIELKLVGGGGDRS